MGEVLEDLICWRLYGFFDIFVQELERVEE